jgi:hypothetical protein
MNLQVIKNRIKKILAYTITSILFLLISAFLVLQMPPVQNRIIKFYLKDFSKITGFTSSIRSFKMLWFDRMELEGLNIYDPAGNSMIRAKKILVNFKLTQLLGGPDINIDGIYVDSAHVFLTKINESDTARDLNINVLITRINEKFSSGASTGGRTPRVNIGEAFLNESQFTYINQDADSITRGFDYNHFTLAVDEGQLESFFILGDTTAFQVKTLIAEDQKTKFKVNQISTFFQISQQSMQFLGLDIHAGKSVISDTIIFQYNAQRDLNDFVDKVKIHAAIKNTIIDPHDLALFAPGVEQLGQPVRVKGSFDGRVDKFKVKDMDVEIGNTHFEGSLDMEGLPNINETFIVLNLKNSKLDPKDLSFLYNDDVLERLKPMGRLNMDAQFLGYPTDFVANGKFTGKLGTVQSDINFKVNEKDFDRSEYSGGLKLKNFDLGGFLSDTVLFQRVTLDGQIAGSGLSEKSADFKLNGKISSIGLNGYNYTKIRTDARFASQLFRGLIEIDDPNLQLLARGSIDLREGINQIKIQAKLDTAYLQKLNLSRDEVFLHTTLSADIRGLTLDSLQGIADFSDFNIQYKDQSLSLDQIHINSSKTGSARSLKLESNLLDTEIDGTYNFSNLLTDVQILSHEISLNIKNDEEAIRDYYRKKTYKPQSYEADIRMKLKNIQPIAQLLKLDLKLSRNTAIEGKFTSGYTTIMNAFTSFDSLVYQGKTFIQNDVQLTASKIADSTSVLSMATINSTRQILNSNVITKNLLVETIWNKNHIDFGLDADQEGQTNYVRLKGMVDFLLDSTVISMEPSTLQMLERQWRFASNNYIAIKNTDWFFNHVTLVNEEQNIEVSGKISSDPRALLRLNIDKLDLSLFNVLSSKKFNGIMDAELDLRNLYKTPTFENNLSIKDFTINDFLVGDISGNNEWDTLQNQFNLHLFVDRMSSRMVNVTGYYKPSDKVTPLNITAALEKAELKIVEPFMTGIFSHMGGTVSGTFKINGLLDNPKIQGEGVVKDGQLMVDYLKTVYRYVGKIGLTENSIYFKEMVLTDAFRNTGTLQGAIYHKNFFDMTIQLEAKFTNFQVLNTSLKDNNLFYGQAYATGNLEFFGPLSNLRISATAKTERNTRMYIPIGGSSTVDKKEFITFVNFKDTTIAKTIQKEIRSKVDLTGLTFDLNLDVTPDAYCEIIFDVKAGDIIRGRGNGDLKLELDTKGEFNMFGPFEFTQGWYNFTLYDIINKEFEIQKGSRITWYGDPYQATLDINASYNQLASLSPILNDATLSNAPALKRKYPVQVLLKLDGPMLSPNINFDIVAKDLPKNVQTDTQPVNLDLVFTAFKNKLDEQELKRQVFSLIVLRRFSPPESFNTSGSVVNSLSELLSNQLSYWMSQVDQNLEIDVDLASMDQESFNTFQLRFSYTLLNGRLRVTGDGTFNNASSNQNTGNQANPSSVAGDWTVDYMLTADGKLRVKMYSRTNVNTVLSSVTNQNAITTGASIIHTQSFNEIRDLWKRSREKKSKDQNNVSSNKEAVKDDEDGTH